MVWTVLGAFALGVFIGRWLAPSHEVLQHDLYQLRHLAYLNGIEPPDEVWEGEPEPYNPMVALHGAWVHEDPQEGPMFDQWARIQKEIEEGPPYAEDVIY